jgi:hypothetical protein
MTGLASIISTMHNEWNHHLMPNNYSKCQLNRNVMMLKT